MRPLPPFRALSEDAVGQRIQQRREGALRTIRSGPLGVQLADRVEIRGGLAEGERIVAAGVFLLDSESRLRATGGAGGHSHGAPTTPQDTPTAPAKNPQAEHEKTSAAPTIDPHAGHSHD